MGKIKGKDIIADEGKKGGQSLESAAQHNWCYRQHAKTLWKPKWEAGKKYSIAWVGEGKEAEGIWVETWEGLIETDRPKEKCGKIKTLDGKLYNFHYFKCLYYYRRSKSRWFFRSILR